MPPTSRIVVRTRRSSCVTGEIVIRRAQALVGPHRPFGNIGDESNILVRCQARNEVEELKNESDMPSAIRSEVSVPQGRQFNIFEKESSARRVVQATHDVEQC